MVRRTLRGTVARDGVGIHTGERVRCELRPAAFGAGIVFHTVAGRVPATVASAAAVAGAMELRADAARVQTPEHLLAALSGLGVTDAEVHLEGPELPALDGSALGWVQAIDEVGRRDGPAVSARLLPAHTVQAAGGEATTAPGPGSLRVEVDFGRDGPRGALEVPWTEEAFRAEVAWARTFVLARDVEALRAAGRGRGASGENTVLWPTALLRSPDEPIRHKLLDLWGDLALLGPARGRVVTVRGSHRLHSALIHSLDQLA